MARYGEKIVTSKGVNIVNHVKCADMRTTKRKRFLPGVNEKDTFYMGDAKEREDLNLNNNSGGGRRWQKG